MHIEYDASRILGYKFAEGKFADCQLSDLDTEDLLYLQTWALTWQLKRVVKAILDERKRKCRKVSKTPREWKESWLDSG